MVACPICSKAVREPNINAHIDSDCQDFVESVTSPERDQPSSVSSTTELNGTGQTPAKSFSNFFQKSTTPKTQSSGISIPGPVSKPTTSDHKSNETKLDPEKSTQPGSNSLKRSFGESVDEVVEPSKPHVEIKRAKTNHLGRVAPLAERMRPKTLDEVCGQELVGPNGVLRGLIEAGRVPSMVLWGGPGTGKTTIARLIAKTAGTHFVEINSTSSGVAECKKLFAEAKNELALTGRKTIIFCDELHRFAKNQQDVFLGPVEAGLVTLIGATTENPSFKVANALLSRCRTFTLAKLTDVDLVTILRRAMDATQAADAPPSPLLNESMLSYLAAFADGDARTALNLLELAMDLATRPNITEEELKQSLTQTLVYDRAGDQHYDTISAFHKAVRGSDPDAALYYLARMLQSGEDALYIARRMIVIASEDVGLADNTMLPLATAAYAAAEKIGMPEARINLAHVAVALALSKKSTRAYRGLGNAMKALQEPGIAGLPIPIHLRNAPTRLMRELGYGAEYKYNPDYVDGEVLQTYLPDKLQKRTFLEDRDLGEKTDPDIVEARRAESTRRSALCSKERRKC